MKNGMNASKMKEKGNKHSKIKNCKYKAIVIGVSAGGLKALKTILLGLPLDFAFSVIIVAHRHSDSDDYLEQYLNRECEIRVKQADEKENINYGVVYLAPPNYHLLIEDDNTFSMSVEEAVNYARPSIDVLFESAAYVYGSELIGVILTGANNDGSQGLKKIKKMGGLTIVQAPETSEFDSMPRAAIAAVEPDYILPIEEIGHFLRNLHLEEK
jgi:two-component system, chemotaxis family, protein-glutamate methylesterase/glutaminase